MISEKFIFLPIFLLSLSLITGSNSSLLQILDVFDTGSNGPTTISSLGPNLPRAQSYVNLIGASYCDPITLSGWPNCIWCGIDGQNLTAVLQNTTFDTMAIVTTSLTGNEIVVTFRGSFNVPNFVADAVMIPVNENGVMVHRGLVINNNFCYS